MIRSWNVDGSRKPSSDYHPSSLPTLIPIGSAFTAAIALSATQLQARLAPFAVPRTRQPATRSRSGYSPAGSQSLSGRRSKDERARRSWVRVHRPSGAGRSGQGRRGRERPPLSATEPVTGRRLSEIMADGPLDICRALRLAIDLGDAVETLHNSGLIHDALRPCNVMVAEDWRVKLMNVERCGWRAENAVRPHHEYLSAREIRQWPGTGEARSELSSTRCSSACGRSVARPGRS